MGCSYRREVPQLQGVSVLMEKFSRKAVSTLPAPERGVIFSTFKGKYIRGCSLRNGQIVLSLSGSGEQAIIVTQDSWSKLEATLSPIGYKFFPHAPDLPVNSIRDL